MERLTQLQDRRCLKCNGLFASTGPGNRICPSCSKQNVREYCPVVSDMGKFTHRIPKGSSRGAI